MPARCGTLSGFRSGRGRPLGLILWRKGWLGGGRICRMKGLRVLGYSCGSNVVRRVSKRDTGDMYDINSCTFLSSGLPLMGRSFKGSAGNKFSLASKKTKALTNKQRRESRCALATRIRFLAATALLNPLLVWMANKIEFTNCNLPA